MAVARTITGCVTVAPAVSPTAAPTPARTATPAPTPKPTATPTAPPTAPPTATPTATPTDPPTLPPTAPPTDSPTVEPTVEPTASSTDTALDPNQAARYGSLEDLQSGFLDDPKSVSIVSGGPIDVSYLGDACSGFAEPNPDYEVHYTAGVQSMLRFYFVATTPGDDATLIINDTASQWHCSDDEFGTTNPSIDFSPPLSGWYDIWIGSYSPSEYISGTLYITELSSNHP
ncbi:MAG: hypothetical protein QFC55_07200 [Chloroflexota bacterium]|nr:hypothetical protein [Chloroflexota bacterium]